MSRCNTVKNRAGNQQMDSSLPNVYELAQRRLQFLFEAFDNIYVSFSGGKDSSVLLNLCIDYIRRHGLDRKIGVFHMDYEIQYRDTVAHVDQVLASNADILEVYRVCVPFKVPTCTSMFQPYWRPWEDYFGAAWQVPWGCLAVIVVVVLAAVVLAVHTPVRRILMQPITATISEL